jgi:hypothetical protein
LRTFLAKILSFYYREPRLVRGYCPSASITGHNSPSLSPPMTGYP